MLLDWDASHPPDDGQLGQGHGSQFEAVRKCDDVHSSGAFRRIVFQTLSHLLLFCRQEEKTQPGTRVRNGHKLHKCAR